MLPPNAGLECSSLQMAHLLLLIKLGLQLSQSVTQTGSAFCAVCHLGRCYGTMVGGPVGLLQGGALLLHLLCHSHVAEWRYLQHIRIIHALLHDNTPALE